jgi:hypothetical protein
MILFFVLWIRGAFAAPAPTPCEVPLNCGLHDGKTVCGHAFQGCDVCSTCCKPFITKDADCTQCTITECKSNPDCCVSFDCTGGQCKRAYQSTGKFGSLGACEAVCAPAPTTYTCAFPAFQCIKVAGSGGQFPSQSACERTCIKPTPPPSPGMLGQNYSITGGTCAWTCDNTGRCPNGRNGSSPARGSVYFHPDGIKASVNIEAVTGCSMGDTLVGGCGGCCYGELCRCNSTAAYNWTSPNLGGDLSFKSSIAFSNEYKSFDWDCSWDMFGGFGEDGGVKLNIGCSSPDCSHMNGTISASWRAGAPVGPGRGDSATCTGIRMAPAPPPAPRGSDLGR